MRKKVITFIRHAESENNFLHRSLGENYLNARKHDPGLTENGIAQAKSLEKYLRERKSLYKFDLVISSPMKRAIQTSKIVFDRTVIHKVVWDNVFEAKGPYEQEKSFTGMKRSEFTMNYPEYMLPPGINEKGWFHYSKPESPSFTFKRSRIVVKNILDDVKYKRIVIISHGKFISHLLTVIFQDYILRGVPCATFFFPNNTSITTLIYSGGYFFIKDMMICPHLENPPIWM